MTKKFFLFHSLILCYFLGVYQSAFSELAPWNDPYPEAAIGGKTILSSFSQRPKRLDPATSYESDGWTFILTTYEPPLQYHYLKRPYTLSPLTTTQLPKIEYLDAQQNILPAETSASKIAFTRYTFELKRNIRYQPHPAFARDKQKHYLYHHLKLPGPYEAIRDFSQQGTRTLVAEDYVYQIKRLADPRLNSPILDLMSQYIVGLETLHKTLKDALSQNPTQDLRSFSLAGVRALDETHYEITIHGQYPAFIHWLTMPFFCPMPWEADVFYRQPGMAERNLSLDWYPIGTGPFMLTQNNPDRQIVLQKNPYFDHETYPSEGMSGDEDLLKRYAGRPLPLVDKVLFTLEKESTANWHKFLQGYYDSSPIASDNFQTAIHFDAQGQPLLKRRLKEQGVSLRVQNTASFFYLGFNFKDEVVGGYSENQRQIRRYIAEHLDLQEFINLFLNGRGLKAIGPIPPDIEGYDYQKPGFIAPVPRPDNLPKTLYYDTYNTGDPEENTRNNWLKDQFIRMGIDLIIRTTDSNRYQERARTGNTQLFMYGWIGDYPDPENFLSIYYGPNISTPEQDGFNFTHYQNKAFDRGFEALKSSTSSEEKSRLLKELLNILAKDQVFAFAYYPQSFVLRHDWLQATKLGTFIRNPLKYIDLDPSLRARDQVAWNQPVLWPLWLGLALVLVFYGVSQMGFGR